MKYDDYYLIPNKNNQINNYSDSCYRLRIVLFPDDHLPYQRAWRERYSGSNRLKSNVELHLEKGAQKIINNDGIDFDGCSHVRVKDSRCQTIRLGCPSDDTIRNAFFTGIEASGNNGIFADFPTRYLDRGDEGYMDLHDIVFDVSCDYPIRFIGNTGYEIGTITLEDFKATVGVEGDPVVVSGCNHLNLERVSVNGEKLPSLQQCGDRRNYPDRGRNWMRSH